MLFAILFVIWCRSPLFSLRSQHAYVNFVSFTFLQNYQKAAVTVEEMSHSKMA